MLHKFFSKFPTIELGNLRLRDMMLSDKEQYYKLMSDPEVTKFLSEEDVPNSVEEAVNEIKFWGGLFYRKQSIFWAVADANSDEFIGTIGFNNWSFNNKRAEISYDLMREHWRKGIMSKCINNIIVFGFQNMELNRIEARTMVDNIPSQKILEKTGFKYEGIQKGYRIIRGESTDVTLWGLTRDDYKGFLA